MQSTRTLIQACCAQLVTDTLRFSHLHIPALVQAFIYTPQHNKIVTSNHA